MTASLYSRFGGVPVSYDVLKTALARYKSPHGRLKLLERRGEVVPLRRGLYLCTDVAHAYSRHLIANHLVFSYVSYESALSLAGMIPERVYTVKSACLGRSRVITNATGSYRYIQVPRDYFNVGVTRAREADGHYYLVATPTKALCDLMLASPGLRLQSEGAVREYLYESLRMDEEGVRSLDAAVAHGCAEAANKKRRELQLLERTIKHERI